MTDSLNGLRIPRMDESDMEYLFNAAIAALRQGDMKSAAKHLAEDDALLEPYVKAVALSKHHQGRIARDAFRFSDAKALFERAVQLNPDEPKYRAALESITSVGEDPAL